MILGFLKPTKAKIIGTVLLIIADWIAGFISGQITQFIASKELIESMTPGFTEIFASVDIVQLMVLGITIMAVSFLLKLVLFYTVISFTIERFVKK
jgi:hypothetical protein